MYVYIYIDIYNIDFLFVPLADHSSRLKIGAGQSLYLSITFWCKHARCLTRAAFTAHPISCTSW